ncbi:LytTR family DNA-binding domain-containing protein [uncultured Dokdonia sp.]|uniref:LytR/AlgR family response regulator transcription factor n=1 Tax=uncultured Dokdonia sp. TaxID=575653 RepID=UPI002635C4F6|nr:LytTR family DNA-binding domain-containing protein [uncultured Dokdonia sp.]
MIKVVLVEDEPLFRADISQLLEAHFKDVISIVGTGYSVASGIKEITTHRPDLVLLDIQLGDGSGFDLLEKISNQDFALIFITGHDTHAIQAIKIGALDYILKPINEDEFVAGIQKAINSVSSRSTLPDSRVIASQFYSEKYIEKIVVSTSDAMHVLQQEDIYYCAADGNYTTFFTISGTIMVARTLKFYDAVFDQSHFIRCHRSYVVNRNHVQRYDKSGFLILTNDIKIPISSRKKNEVLKTLFG